METKEVTKHQKYMKEYNKRPEVVEKKREYNQRPDVAEKRMLLNKRLHICECGGHFTTIHKKQHCEGTIHKDYLNTGIKYELPENQKNKLYYDERLMEIHKKYFPEEK